MNFKTTALITTSGLALAQPVLAQDFYAGAVVGFGSAVEKFANTTSPTGTGATASLLAGVSFDINENYFVGAEAEIGTQSLDQEWLPVRAQRLRAIAGYKMDKLDVFVAAGVVKMQGNGCCFDEGSGVTLGVGVNYHLNDKLDIRAEIISDDAEIASAPEYTWDQQQVRVGAIFKF